jgi:hypothetical protein
MGRYSTAEMRALVAMLANGKPYEEIAATLHRSVDSVRVKGSRIKNTIGERIRPRPAALRVTLRRDELDALQHQAAIYGADSVEAYVGIMLKTIIDDRLFDAVLDPDAG